MVNQPWKFYYGITNDIYCSCRLSGADMEILFCRQYRKKERSFNWRHMAIIAVELNSLTLAIGTVRGCRRLLMIFVARFRIFIMADWISDSGPGHNSKPGKITLLLNLTERAVSRPTCTIRS